MRGLRLAVGAAGAVIALAACNEEVTESPFLPETVTPAGTAAPTPTAAITPLASPAGSPLPGGQASLDGFREFAGEIDQALRAGDASFFAGLALEDALTCSGAEELGPCAGQPAGAVVQGVPSGIWRTDAAQLVPPADYGAALAEWFAAAAAERSDEFGGGGPAVYALAHGTTGRSGADAFQAVLTGIIAAPEPLRQARVLSFQFVGEGWRLTGDILASSPETARDWLSGDCAECYDHWERWEGSP